MAGKFMDILRLAKPLSKKQQQGFVFLSKILDKKEIKELKVLVKQNKVSFLDSMLKVSPQVIAERSYVSLHCDDAKNKETKDFVEHLNKVIHDNVYEKAFKTFSKDANELIPKLIAMNIRGFDIVKKAAALQLFASPDEPLHILLLGDPGTGKTDILRSTSSMHPISSFGLGSGTSSVGLSVTVKGKEVTPGLLPLADKGLCAIDELNLMEQKDRASLYNAMEKGFITYDKGGSHYKFDARISVLATANPKGDRFVGWTVETLKKQLPFDPALLSRFHLVFLIRKPDLKQFKEISRKIIRDDKKAKAGGDEKFVQEYVRYAQSVEVSVPSKFEQQIVDFVAEIKKNEKKYLVEVSPRLVLGFIRLAKASARMQLRAEIRQEDIDVVKEIVSEGLKLSTK